MRVAGDRKACRFELGRAHPDRGPDPIDDRAGDEARALGFVAFGITPATSTPEAGARLRQWLAEGRHGDMLWMEARADERAAPQGLWPDVRSVIALGLPTVFGGAIITEQVFKVNGLGQLLITAIYANDIPMVQTLTFIFAVLIVLFNLIADILYGILDPRIRYD